MLEWLRQLDAILRGEATRPEDLMRRGIHLSPGGVACVCLILAMLYGACMGSFALFRVVDDPSLVGTYHRVMQWVASTVKVPALFLLTLAVTFPSLYVFNALVGSRLNLVSLLKLLLAALAVNVAVLASLGPIVAFFSVSTTGYSFMVLLNVLVFAAAGVLGLYFLLQTLHRLSGLAQDAEPSRTVPPPPSEGQGPHGEELAGEGRADSDDGPLDAQVIDRPGALDWVGTHLLGDHVRAVFYCWIILFGLVGAQMGWVLRPFIGNPDKPFTWFRARESNFFEAVWHSLMDLFF